MDTILYAWHRLLLILRIRKPQLEPVPTEIEYLPVPGDAAPHTVRLYINGQMQEPDDDYSLAVTARKILFNSQYYKGDIYLVECLVGRKMSEQHKQTGIL